jgi:hypothetical protein
MRSAQLIYCILCDDVRVEMGNKLSLMGVFENIFLPGFPSVLLKFAVVNHWEGVGEFETQVRIMNPDKREVVTSAPSKFLVDSPGYADNITFFTNVAFERPGVHLVQTFIDSRPVAEKQLLVHLVTPGPTAGPTGTVH